MTGFFSPNFSILQEWKSTFSVAFSQLRRVAFATEDTFTFLDFDPQLDFGGMTVTNLVIYKARYCKVGKMLFFSVTVGATLAAPLISQVVVILPENLTARGSSSESSAMACRITNAGVEEIGSWRITATTNKLLFKRTAGGAYTAGAFEMIANGFIEVN